MNSTKSWSDRADKDLFFTILQVKNIGVISGGEWQTIGSALRAMGYGFTNEGCRQHFQGLRRAQNKAETTATGADGNPRRLDPSENPITRRPGPGRGRPRKQPVAGGAGTPTASPQGQPQGQATPQVQPQPAMAVPPQGQPQLQPQLQPQPMPQSMSQPMAQPMASMMDNELAGAPDDNDTSLADGLPLDHDPDDLDEPDAKRPRLDENTDPSLEDEAVMNALAAHSSNTPVDAYGTEFNYGEA